MRSIRITTGDIDLQARLNDSDTADLINNALPITGRVQMWGDEIYFPIPVSAGVDDAASDVVDKGAIAFWPPGNALCLFWGPTPASRGDEIRAASAVNVCGTIDGDPTKLANAVNGAEIRVEAA